MNREIKIYKSKLKAAILLIFCLFFFMIGILVLQNSDKAVAGWSCIIIALLASIVGFYNLFDRRPQIIMNDDGITERTFKGEVIEWDAILNVDELFYRGQYYVRLMVDKDYKPTLVRSHWLFRIDRYYARAGVKALYIKVSMLTVSSGDLTNFIHAMAGADNSRRDELIWVAPGMKMLS